MCLCCTPDEDDDKDDKSIELCVNAVLGGKGAKVDVKPANISLLGLGNTLGGKNGTNVVKTGDYVDPKSKDGIKLGQIQVLGSATNTKGLNNGPGAGSSGGDSTPGPSGDSDSSSTDAPSGDDSTPASSGDSGSSSGSSASGSGSGSASASGSGSDSSASASSDAAASASSNSTSS